MNHRVMNRRVTRLLLALYPRAWRDRFGAEVASLTDELIRAGETTPLPAGLNLVAGAAVERARALAGSRSALAVTSAAAIVVLAGGAFVVTGSPRPGPGPRAIASANCVVEPPFQVAVSAAPVARLRPLARARLSEAPRLGRPQFGRPPSGPAPSGRSRSGQQARVVAIPARPPVLVGRTRVVVASPRMIVARPRVVVARPRVLVARPGRGGRVRPAETGRVPRIARSCQRPPAAAQDPVPGPARILRVRPPVSVATRVTR